jgi:extradiol dioxygenase family protein
MSSDKPGNVLEKYLSVAHAPRGAGQRDRRVRRTSAADRFESPAAIIRTVYPFHLSTIVRDLAEARHFYSTILGRPELRATPTSLHLDFWGSQLTLHGIPGFNAEALHREVDAEIVPVPHFGSAISLEEFHEVADRLNTGSSSFSIHQETPSK